MWSKGLSAGVAMAWLLAAGAAAADPAPAAQALDGLTGAALNLAVKNVDVVAVTTVGSHNAYTAAASEVFRQVLHPYYAALDARGRDAVLQRISFSCAENLIDPTTAHHALAFPVQLLPVSGALVWHRYACTFNLRQGGLLAPPGYTSPVYTINQLDLRYGAAALEPAVALQNYNVGTAKAPDYAWLGRYVQPLDQLLRDDSGAAPAKAIAGVNGGYDYRVDAWASRTPHDNICAPRYNRLEDPRGFYSQHPPPVQCPMNAQGLPACAAGASLPIADDLGDSLIYLAAAQRAKSWRQTPLQSYNCGSIGELVQRGALLLYRDDVYTARTAASSDGVAALALDGKPAQSAIGAGPLLLQDGAFVYDQTQSEEGMPLDNYEVGGATGVGYARAADGTLTVHIVNVDGQDGVAGMHDWLLGLYFLLAPQAKSAGAVALGNGGDATLWINPQAPTVQALLRDTRNANHAYFEALFAHNSHDGIVSNCSGFGSSGSLGCNARPVHDGLFIYAP
jgi:hypothetical protein